MKEIPLTQGKVTIVDDEDFYFLNNRKWFFQKGYAVRNNNSSEKRGLVGMHRDIMNPPSDMMVDHIDGNPLNNQRSNLRICTASQNGMNKGMQKNNTSGYKGVSWVESRKRWRACLMINKKMVFSRKFKTAEEAARAYDEQAKRYFGEFAKTNF